jgi:DNA-3-methyladenine glycosylase
LARGPAGRRDIDLCSGPAKLCQALGIDGSIDGADLGGSGAVRLLDDGMAPPANPSCTTRIGLSKGVERPWRWFVPGDSNVSTGRPSGADGGR